MLKSIQLNFLKMKYGGDSIGDDIRVEIEALGKFLRVDKKIKIGTTAEINREVGRFETDQKSFKFNTQIVVIEKDLLFNDIGQANLEIKIDATNAQPQQFSRKIEIKETRSIFGKIWGKKIAVFEIILEAIVSDAILYVSLEQGKGGWTNAKLENKNIVIALPAHLKVKLDSQDSERQYFTILEGPWIGEYASVKIESDGISHLESINRQTAPIYLAYSVSKNILKFKTKTYKTRRHPDDAEPPERGLYDLEIPDSPHGPGEYYLDRARLAKVWFSVGHDKSGRYLHAGSVTRGCITLTEIERWDELCKILMKARKGDGVSIGVIEIAD